MMKESKTYLKVWMVENDKSKIYQAKKVDFSTFGLQDVLQYNKKRRNERTDLPKIREIGTFVTLCSKPLTKTRIIKFVPRIRIVNNFGQKLEVREPNVTNAQE